MFTFQPIGYVRSPYRETIQVPKGPGTQHQAEGVLEVHPAFEEGLLDIEGFSHLFIVWIFHRSEGYELTGIPPTDDRPHGVFATRSPYRPNPIGLTVVELVARAKALTFACAVWTCWMERQFSTSNRICRVFLPINFAWGGLAKRKREGIRAQSIKFSQADHGRMQSCCEN
jgi:tRNA-Thr(GGU) m(6)t(6)A37 methyltransferase TsaA